MNKLFDNLRGRKFGMLKAVAYVQHPTRTKKGKHGRLPMMAWLCDCECGKQTIVSAPHLKSGNTKSCGCLGGQEKKSDGGRPWTQEELDSLTMDTREFAEKFNRSLKAIAAQRERMGIYAVVTWIRKSAP